MILVGSRLEVLAPLRTQLSALSVPFYWLVDVPARISEQSRGMFSSRKELIEENQALRAESLILNAKLQ
ncbi:MAG: rod shape-determining protein MreC, partial [Spongiibacter sp.]